MNLKISSDVETYISKKIVGQTIKTATDMKLLIAKI